MAQLYRVVPIQFEGNTLTVATCDPQNLINSRTSCGRSWAMDIAMVVATERDVIRTLDRYYGPAPRASKAGRHDGR